jgi:hypothetical protein
MNAKSTAATVPSFEEQDQFTLQQKHEHGESQMFQLRIYGAITKTVPQFFFLSEIRVCVAINKMKPRLNNNTGFLHTGTDTLQIMIFLLNYQGNIFAGPNMNKFKNTVSNSKVRSR